MIACMCLLLVVNKSIQIRNPKTPVLLRKERYVGILVLLQDQNNFSVSGLKETSETSKF